ncbi:NifB/NifX family molybdenum-iron cluster-binding protein [Bacteroidota bacterium]
MSKNIAVAVESVPNGETRVSEHFGRCTSFYIYALDNDNKIIKQEDHPNQIGGQHSSACQLPPYVKELNADVVIAGGMGMKAISQFNNFGIEVVTAPGLVPQEALELYLSGKIAGYDPCKHHDGKC